MNKAQAIFIVLAIAAGLYTFASYIVWDTASDNWDKNRTATIACISTNVGFVLVVLFAIAAIVADT